MKHFDDDTLLQFALDTLDTIRSKDIQQHIDSCDLCREKLNLLQQDIDAIGSFQTPAIKIDFPNLMRNRARTFWIKRAAVVIVFLGGGYFAIHSFDNDIEVVGQKLKPQSPPVTITESTHCPEVDLL